MVAPSLPTCYLAHGGGPLPLIGEPSNARLVPHWVRIGEEFPHPKAVLIVSAHWEEELPTIQLNPKPELEFDYYGFPSETYEYKYPVLPALEVGERVGQLLTQAGIEHAKSTTKNFDHGVFVPMMKMYPSANIPILQVSLQTSLDVEAHIRLGAALSPLRSEGVLLLASGFSFHNLPGIMGGLPRQHVAIWSKGFNDWLKDVCTNSGYDRESRLEMLRGWRNAPYAAECHPREEHLIPLMVAAGAAMDDCGALIYNDEAFMGSVAVSSYRFG
mmetsp:Transcript_17946/g.21495  ORF Transcript_17946/g.21495 Transcript_17946/m.21495 type:complete len:272 (+) Transcript_17946:161-976(+)